MGVLYTRQIPAGARAAILAARIAKASPKELISEATAAAAQLRKWGIKAESKSVPIPIDDSPKHVAAMRRFCGDADLLRKFFPEKRIDQFSFEELTSLTSALDADRRTPFQLPKLNQIERSLETAGVGTFIAYIRQRQPQIQVWPDLFQYAWLASALDDVSQTDPEIRGFVVQHTVATSTSLRIWTKSELSWRWTGFADPTANGRLRP